MYTYIFIYIKFERGKIKFQLVALSQFYNVHIYKYTALTQTVGGVGPVHGINLVRTKLVMLTQIKHYAVTSNYSFVTRDIINHKRKTVNKEIYGSPGQTSSN